MAFGFGLGFPRAAVNSGGAFAGAALALDMTSGNQTLDPRVTFTRTSNATVTGPDGTIGYAPHNLLTHSEQFDNAAWAKFSGAVVTANQAASPNGTTTADLVNLTTGGLFQSVPGTANTQYVFSVWLRADSPTTSRLVINTNLSDPTLLTVSVTDQWQRFSISKTTSAGTSSVSAQIDSGSGANICYAWGAQLNVGALQPYYPTTVKNLLGYTQEFDNAAWTKSNSFVQTNLCLYSRELDSVLYTQWQFSIGAGAWAPTETTAAPDGTVSGRTYTAVAGGNANTGYQVMAVTAATVYTWSLHVKLGTLPQNELKIAFRDDTAGVFIAQDIAPTLISVGNGWGRLTYTLTTPVGCGLLRCYAIRNTSPTVGGTVSFWGAQLVQGSSPGDYVTTYGTTRAVMYAAPDGTMTADKAIPTTVNGDHLVVSSAGPAISGTVYSFSVYAKAAEYSFLRLSLGGVAGGGFTFFNLATGTIGTTAGMAANEIIPVGNGWYRCSVRRAASSSAGIAGDIYLTSADNQFSWTGNGTSGIYIWGAQLSDSASLDPYVYNPGAAPAASAYYGPRFDYDPVTLQPKGLLIEEQRTNILPTSEQFSANAGLVVSNNAATSPAGTTTAAVFTEDSSLGNHAAGSTAATFSVVATNISFYAKPNGRSWVLLRLQGVSRAYFNIATGTVGTVDASVSATTIIPAGNGWYRCSVTLTPTAGTANVFIRLATSDGVDSYQGNGTSGALIYGMQIEAGAFPTSYIPTTTAAATRAADGAVMTGANFSSWYRQDEGTLFAEFGPFGNAGPSRNPGIISIDDGTSNNLVRLFAGSTISPVFGVNVGGVSQAYISNGTLTPSQVSKIAGAYKTNDFARSINGAGADTDSVGTVPAVSLMRIGTGIGGVFDLNGHIRRIAYFPRRLSNAELQGITA